MDLSRILGTVLEGALQPPRRATRRRRTTAIPGLGRSRSGTAQLTRALAGLATAAAEALASRPAAPAPRPQRPVPDLRAPTPAPAPASRGSVPASGPSPWAPKPAPPAAAPEAETAEALLMIRAMIAAARGDGRIDAEERQAIAGQLDGAGLSAAERDFVLADFDNPLTPEALAKEARDPMQAAQLYAAAFAAAGEVSTEERAWLDRLGRALRLDRVALAAIEKRLGG